MLVASFACKGGRVAATLAEEGVLKDKSVVTLRDGDVLSSPYLCAVQAFMCALRLLRRHVDNNPGTDAVLFETNNSTLVKWVEEGYSKDQYQEMFSDAMDLLNEIPVRYMFCRADKPFALKYASGGKAKVALSGLED